MNYGNGRGPGDHDGTTRGGRRDPWDETRRRERQAFSDEFGLMLRGLRARAGLSQIRVASMAGVSMSAYQMYESGEFRPGMPNNPRLMTVIALAQALGVSLAELLPEHVPDMTDGR